MRLHVFWFALYSGAIVIEVLCDNIVVRCMAIAGLAVGWLMSRRCRRTSKYTATSFILMSLSYQKTSNLSIP